MPEKRRTNTDKVVDFMTFSENGAMSQLLVMEAIGRYSRQLDALTDEQVNQSDDNSFISMAALRRTAREWLEKYEDK